jgi:hypothetical protein
MPRDSPPDPVGEVDHASPAGLDGRLHRALTDMHAYAMFLESQSEPRDLELQDELEALRSATVALREQGSAERV